MANTSVESKGERFLQVTYTDSGDNWVSSVSLRPKAVFFAPSATGDILVVRETSVTGVKMFKVKSLAGETVPVYLNGDAVISIAIPLADCTFSTPGNVLITVEFD